MIKSDYTQRELLGLSRFILVVEQAVHHWSTDPERKEPLKVPTIPRNRNTNVRKAMEKLRSESPFEQLPCACQFGEMWSELRRKDAEENPRWRLNSWHRYKELRGSFYELKKSQVHPGYLCCTCLMETEEIISPLPRPLEPRKKRGRKKKIGRALERIEFCSTSTIPNHFKLPQTTFHIQNNVQLSQTTLNDIKPLITENGHEHHQDHQRDTFLLAIYYSNGLGDATLQHCHSPSPPAMDPGMADNVKKFSEIYGIATQLMNLGGNILSNAGGQAGPAAASRGSTSSSYGGNGVLGEVVRPQLRGLSNYESAPSYDGMPSSSQFGKISEYGGGLLGSGSRSQPRGILDTLMGSFLGSSIGSSGSSSSPNFFSPNNEEYGAGSSRYGGAKQGSNIEAIVDALSRSGAKRAEPAEAEAGAASLLSQFFGGRKR
uniref:BED-type domain-containing protein n=1 Tax=Ditylenchus dipsaci TaxID=166011 RepID=A0A915EEB5_9BILA